MFYPYEPDNQRLIGILLKTWRMRRGDSQQVLAHGLGIPRGLVNAAENLYTEKISDQDSRRINRKTLIEIHKQLEPQDTEKSIDALLWLFDGQVLQDSERDEFYPKIIKEGKSLTYRKNKKRMVLEQLGLASEFLTEHSLKYRRPPNELKIKPANYHSYKAPRSYRVDGTNISQCLDIQTKAQIASVWLVMRETPPEYIRYLDFEDPNAPLPPGIATGDLNLIGAGINAMLEYGVKMIFETPALINSINPLLQKPKAVKKAREMITTLINILKKNEGLFRVKLVSDAVPFELQIHGLETAFLTNRANALEYLSLNPAEYYCPHYQILEGDQNVLPYILGFETFWDKLSETQSNNASVIKILEGILKEPKSKKAAKK